MVKKGTKQRKYTAEFKQEVVEAYLSGKYGGKLKVAIEFGIDKRQVINWVRQYEKGIESLVYENRGKNATGRPKSTRLEDMSLEDQVRFLKMENDILKKVRALLKD